MRRPLSSNLVQTARSLHVDVVTAEIVSALRMAGVRSIVLKGASIAAWLYTDGTSRPYRDSDLLVQPAAFDAAESILMERAFHKFLGAADFGEEPGHASTWRRDSDDAWADLHHTLLGAYAGWDTVWQALADSTEHMRIGGATVEVLSPPARALHIALHAAQHGVRAPGPLNDLVRALQLVPLETWHDAVEIARAIGAVPALSAGLRLVPAGRELAKDLELSSACTVEIALRAQTAPPTALGFMRLRDASSMRLKIAILRHEAVPAPGFLRVWTPLATRGRLGLAAAYIWRPVWLVLHSGSGIRALRKARRTISDSVQAASVE